MDVRYFILLYLTFIIGIAECASKVPKMPKNLMRCRRKIPTEELNECMRKAIEDGYRKLKKGDPSINVQQFDPLSVPDIRTSQSSGPVSVKITQTNVIVSGISNVQVKNIRWNFDKNTLYGEYYVPRIVQIADQRVDGRILVFPITGSGKANYTTLGYRAEFTGNFKEQEKNGYHYYKFDEKTFRYKILRVDQMIFKFENLFGGDKALGNTMNRVLNENWKVLSTEINPTSEKIFGKMLVNALNSFFGYMPVEEIFLD